MYRIQSAIFVDRQQRRSQFEHDHGRMVSRLVEHSLTGVCELPEYQDAGSNIYIYNKNSIRP